MSAMNEILLIGALLLLGSIVLGAISSRLGLPFLLVFLVVGMLAGEDGLGGIAFDDYRLSLLIGNLALAIILLDGGLRTRLATFRVALRPSLALATLGVMISAGLVGVAAVVLLGVDWRTGLLLGAIVGSTDAAAVFAMLRNSGIRLNERVESTLEIESGANDPMAVFLTIVLIESILRPDGLTAAGLLLDLLQQFGIGAAAGVLLGAVLAQALVRAHVNEGLKSLLVCSGGVAIFALANLMGGSGFLAAYLAGLVVGNRRQATGEGVLRAMDGFAWLSQSGMFLLLGLLVTPHDMLDSFWPALLLAAFLMLVARPLSVWLTLLPFRFAWREVAFICWVGLRGAVPIVLALFPLLAGVAGAQLLFNVAFVVVLASLLLQGTTIATAARWFGVGLPSRAEPLTRSTVSSPGLLMVEFPVRPDSPLVGVALARMQLPGGTRPLSVLRGERPIEADTAVLRGGDRVLLLAAEDDCDRLGEVFGPAADLSLHFYGDFTLDGDAPIAEVCAVYGHEAEPEDLGATLDAAIRRRRPRVVEGDSVVISGLQFIARSVVGGSVRKVGLRLPRPARQPAPR